MTQTLQDPHPGGRSHDERRRATTSTLLGPRWSLTLLVAVTLSGVAAVAAVVGLVVDPSRITGAAAWLKPLKFGISIAVYCATVLWLLQFLRRSPRTAVWVARVTAVSLLVELALIDLQVLRGQSSHFNTSTVFDAVVYQTMGFFAVTTFLGAAVVAVFLLKERLPQPLGTGVRAALAVTVLGMGEAFVMVLHNGHTVGAADGGPGLPMTDWSTQHGDLRVAHFVGLHALQAILVLTWVLVRFAPELAARHGSAVLRTAATAYAGIVVLLTWQALRGQALTDPDALSSTVVTAWLLACAVAAAVVLRRPYGTRTPVVRGGTRGLSAR